MKKVLVTGMTQNLGGVEKFIVNFCEKITDKDIKFDFIVTDKRCALENKIRKMNSKIYYVTEKHYKNPIKFRKQIGKYMQNEKYDAIWVNDCSLNSFHYIKIAKKMGIPKRIIHSHNSKNMDTSIKGTIKYAIHLINKHKVKKYATHYWACSDLAADFFYLPQIRQSVTIINNAIDTQKFKFNSNTREKIRKKLKIEDEYVLGNVGRLHFQKNQIYLLEIFMEYLKYNSKSKLILIGEGQERKKIEEFIKNNKLKDNVILLGICDNVNEIMQAMDLFLLPSLFEGLPIVGIEAQCSGLPCIFSENITKDVKILEETYFMKIKERDKKAWVEKVKKIQNKKINRELAERKIKESGFDIEIEAEKLRRFFKE